MRRALQVSILLVFLVLTTDLRAGPRTGEEPNLGTERITQEQVEGGMSLNTILQHGKRMFSTPFNQYDGYGDGPFDPLEDPRHPGGRASLQGNGMFLRVNGLDGQTCLECHFIVKNSTIPATLGIGGVAGNANNAIVLPSRIDVADMEPGTMNGRFTSPPFLFGSGGVELLAKEMTADLQRLKEKALQYPGVPVELVTKGVSFGMLVSPDGTNLDTSGVEGVDDDLVIRPFGRKGEFGTVRQFDIEALQFHFGMQPAELVGDGVDQDGDGVPNEIMAGELSVLHIFNTNFPKPVRSRNREFKAVMGEIVFDQIGCASCHIPVLETESQWLTYSYPEDLEHPEANVFYAADLTDRAGFRRSRSGGLSVDLFSDLKRHDMGDHLADATDFLSDAFNRAFITARLWGIRDTGPYLHDGRATTLKDAITLHGGEAQGACDGFNGLSEEGQEALIAFLYTLRTPSVERYVRGPRFEMFPRRHRDARARETDAD